MEVASVLIDCFFIYEFVEILLWKVQLTIVSVYYEILVGKLSMERDRLLLDSNEEFTLTKN